MARDRGFGRYEAALVGGSGRGESRRLVGLGGRWVFGRTRHIEVIVELASPSPGTCSWPVGSGVGPCEEDVEFAEVGARKEDGDQDVLGGVASDSAAFGF